MKKLCALLLLFSLPLFGTQQTKKDLFSYILKLQLPSGMHPEEAFCGFYKGKPIEFDKNWALLPEDGEALAFSIIVTPEVGFKAQGTNVRYMQRKDDQPFAWYDITLEFKDQKQVWHISQLDAQEAPKQLPDHAIIILLDPKLVEGVVEPTALACVKKAEARDPNAPRVIILPTLVLEKDITEEELTDACVHAQFSALELRAIHKKPSMEIKKEQLAIIALCNQ